MEEKIDYKLAAEQLRSGKPLFGEGSALASMLERTLNCHYMICNLVHLVHFLQIPQ